MSHNPLSQQQQTRPVLRDYDLWTLALHDHRRALFERFLEAYPHLKKTRGTDIEVWRTRLSGPRLNYPNPDTLRDS